MKRDRQGKRLGGKSVYVCLMSVCVKKGERVTKKADKDDFITSARVCVCVFATEGEVSTPLNSASASHRH